jgi:ATP/maltotriose-dependent transcriptional regulator MalT
MATALEDLEKRRIIVIETTGNRGVARLSHPLYAEVVVAGMPSTRARQVRRGLADDLERTGIRRRDDALRLALWRIDGGGPVDTAILLQAAGTAIGSFDAPLAERLARAALGKDGSVAAALLLGRALAAQHRVAEADDVLRAAADDATTDGDVARAALARADLLYFRAGRSDDATRVLLEALDQIVDIDWRDELQAILILFRAGAGQLFEVAESGRRIAARTDASPRPVVQTLVYSSIANVMLGRIGEADEHVRIALDLAPAVADELPLSGDLLRINRALGNAYAGRIGDALAAGHDGLQQALDARSTELVGLWSVNLAEILMLAGDIEVALRSMLEGLIAAREGDPFGIRGIAASLGAICATWLGRPEQADSLRREVVDLGLARDVRARICFERSTVWATWLGDGSEAAARLAQETGPAAVTDTHLVWAAWQFHDAVRLGHPSIAVTPLETLASQIEGDLVSTMALHARAMDDGDAATLERVASTFDLLGCRLVAAEAAAHAQRAYLRHGRDRLARVAGARAMLIAAGCPGVRTPALADATAVPLTARELEIARLSATGLSSRAVSDRLEISVRTVDNHLGNVYSKLGISGRRELPAVLGINAE